MAGITQDTSFTLDGVNDLLIGQWGDFRWFQGGDNLPWMSYVEVGPGGPVSPGIKLNITFAGTAWEMAMLRINMGAQFNVTITDKVTTGGYIEFLNLSHGPSNVKLNHTSVMYLRGGRGDDNITRPNPRRRRPGPSRAGGK
jgi:hypothetical protein